MAAGSIPSPKELDNLSKEICDCWDSLGIQLGVELSRIDSIRNDNVQFSSLERKAFAMLTSWYDKGSGSTYHVLSEALRKVDKARLAEKYCGVIEADRAQVCQQQFHDNAVLDYFCKTCQCYICEKCSIVTHKNHDVEYLKEAAEKTRPRFQETENKTLERADTWKEQTNKDKETRREIKSQNEQIRRAIQENSCRLMELMKRHEQELLTQVDSFEEDQMKALENQRKNLNLFEEQLKGITEHMHSVKLQGSNDEVLEAGPTADRTQLDSLANYQPLKTFDLVYKPDEDVILRLERSPLGRVQRGLAEAQKTRNEGLEEKRIEKERSTKLSPVVKKDAEDSACYSSSEHVSEKIPNRSIPVAKGRSRGYEAVATFGSIGSGNGEFQFPCGIAVNTSGEVAVSDSNNDRVQIFNADGQYRREFGTRGIADGQFRRPVGLAYNKTGHIVVADQCNSRIQVFSSTGLWISKFGREVLKQPCGVSVTSDNNTVVCDSTKKTVNVFCPDGELLLQFSPGTIPQSAVFCGEKYFVSVGGHVIKVFDSRGSRLCDIGQRGREAGQFKYPWGLAVDTDDLLLVCDRNNYRVQVFKYSGDFVTSFGSHGYALGQFIHPVYIAVSRDGHVFVTERENHRVQVFQVQ